MIYIGYFVETKNIEKSNTKVLNILIMYMFNMNKDNIDCVIYHKNCVDGSGSACIAWKYLSKKYPDRKVEYIPAVHYEEPPNVDNKNVLIVDFSYSYSVLQDMISRANSILILDHHKTAYESLKNIDDKYKIFRMDMSGASLAWNYFFPNEEMPLLVKYIEDRDIWTNKLPLIEEYAAWFFTLEHDFNVYSKYFNNELFEEALKTKGTSMAKLNRYNIDRLSSYAIPKFCKIGNKYYFVSYLNSNVLKSDIGNKVISSIHPLADFSAIYSIDDRTNSTSFSLRSTNEHTDVSVIAKLYGGGGHRNASGLRISSVTNTLPCLTYEHSGSLYNSLLSYLDTETICIDGTYYNIVIINNMLLRNKVCKYLLQTNNKYQNCSRILANKYNEEKYKTTLYHFAFNWYYDSSKKKTNLRLSMNEALDNDDYIKMINLLQKTGGEQDTLDNNVFYFDKPLFS